MIKNCIITLAAVLVVASVASAAAIDVGSHNLLANTAGQKIYISITGGEALIGMNFNAQVGDGGPELADYGYPAGTDGPAITGVNFDIAGGMFNGTGSQDDLGSLPQLQMWMYNVTAGSAAANGLLVELTLDTTGFYSGSWDLMLGDVFGGQASTEGVIAGGNTLPIDITNGSITIVPEPATLVLLSVAGGLAAVRRARRK